MSTRRDTRTYITVHDGMPDHPKIEGLSDAAFRALITLWCWCSSNLTDGHVTPASWRKRAGDAGPELVAAGLAREVEGGFVMHDYLEHQRSREQVEELREKRREAGKRGGIAKAQRVASATASAKHVAKQTGGKSVAETETETEPASNEAGLSTSDADASDEQTFSADVYRLTNLFVELVTANGHKARATTKWFQACDRLMRLDNYTPEQIEWLMRWATKDEFWAANIRSLPTFREKFSQLAFKARQEYDRSRGVRKAPAQEVADIIALGERMQAELEGRAS